MADRLQKRGGPIACQIFEGISEEHPLRARTCTIEGVDLKVDRLGIGGQGRIVNICHPGRDVPPHLGIKTILGENRADNAGEFSPMARG